MAVQSNHTVHEHDQAIYKYSRWHKENTRVQKCYFTVSLQLQRKVQITKIKKDAWGRLGDQDWISDVETLFP